MHTRAVAVRPACPAAEHAGAAWAGVRFHRVSECCVVELLHVAEYFGDGDAPVLVEVQDVVAGAVVRWSDVAIDERAPHVALRREMERAFAKGAK